MSKFGEWIEIKEGGESPLPPITGRGGFDMCSVLLARDDRVEPGFYKCGCYLSQEGWISWGEFDGTSNGIDKPTHWMKLPEPPK